MSIILNGVSNPGWSFKDHRIKQLNEMLNWMVNYDSNEYISFKELQSRLEVEDNSLGKSIIRMLFPALENYGVLNGYKEDFIPSAIVTNFGRQFTVFTDIYLEIINNGNEALEEVSRDLLKEFLFQSYLNLLGKWDAEENIYLQVAIFLKEFNKLTYVEFFLITTGIYDSDKNLQWAREMIESNRINGLTTSKPDKHENAWGYIIPFLEESDLIIRDGYTIHPKESGNYQKLINGGII